MQTLDSPVIVDVRLPNEWMGLRIGTVVNLPLNRLAEMAPAKLDPGQMVVTVCNSAFRSSLAVGILERLGFRKLASLDGGSEAWIAAGLPTFGPEAQGGLDCLPRGCWRRAALLRPPSAFFGYRNAFLRQP